MIGQRLGPYEVLAKIGEGGMGEVYQALDSRLGRSVALKLLPEAWLGDSAHAARLEREARTLAALNHPHVASLYGFEDVAGRHFLVMELVEGETLADRLARGPMRVDEALSVADQIIAALEAAHEKGIVHRDLKPANVKITPDDRVKVLDFGLARLQEKDEPAARPNVTHSPTLSVLATQAGVILGTAAYMSPEQAKGLVADHRSDLFSFGAVLFEMLTGRQAFHGDTAAETMAAVLMREPDFALLPADLNPRLTELLRRCLEKNPRRRWHAAADLRAEIETVIAAPRAAPAAIVATRTPVWKRVIPFAASALLAGGLVGAIVWQLRPAPASQRTVAFSVPFSEDYAPFRRVAISRDGSRIAYSSDGRLWVRDVANPAPRAIPGIENANIGDPVFSPDGQSIAFVSVAERALKTINISGGTAISLTSVDVPFSLDWDPSGILLTQTGVIRRIPATRGPIETIIKLGEGERAHAPQMLSDGKTVLFTVIKGVAQDAWDRAEIVAQSIGSGARRSLVTGTDSRYLPSGHLLFTRGGVLFAATFDAARSKVGAPVAVLQGIRRGSNAAAEANVSETGSLVYVPGPALLSASIYWDSSQLAVRHENGMVEALKLPDGPYQSPRISPDGSRLAYGSDSGSDAHIWVYDLNGGISPRQLTFRGRNRYPVWSPDSRSIAFQSDRDGDLAIFHQLADASGPVAERLTKASPGIAHVPESWSRNGDLLFSSADASSATLWTLSVRDKRTTQFGDVRSSAPFNAEFSPDGAWVSYTVRGGPAVTMIYVGTFPPSGREYPVTPRDEVAHHPVWARDGQALFYVPAAADMVRRGVVKQRALLGFREPSTWPGKLPNVNPFGAPRNFDVFPDGKRFIYTRPVNPASPGAEAPQIQVIVNWVDELRRQLMTEK